MATAGFLGKGTGEEAGSESEEVPCGTWLMTLPAIDVQTMKIHQLRRDRAESNAGTLNECGIDIVLYKKK